MRTCNCGTEFEPKVHNARYCSPRCKRDAENAAKRAVRADEISSARLTRTAKQKKLKDGRYFLWPDTHYPYEDKRAVAAALNALQGWAPDHLVILGDFLDCEGVSRFPKAPTHAHGARLQTDIDRAKEGLNEIRQAAGNAEKIFLEGNHEFRVERYTMERAPELWGLKNLEFSELLGTEDMGYLHVPYTAVYHELQPGLIATHGRAVAKHSAQSAQKEVDKWNYSGVSGHTHKLGVFHRTTFDGYNIWMECGFLGSMEVPGAEPNSNWQQGFATLQVVDGHVWGNTHRVVDGKVVLDGKLYKA